MSGGNLSPRQKMINMMYLVLTALLALNVSAEILDAFNSLRSSLQSSAESFAEKNQETKGQILEKIREEMETGNKKNENLIEITKEVEETSISVINYIESLTLELNKIAELDENGEYVNMKETEGNFQFWMGPGGDQANDGRGAGAAFELRNKLNGFVKYANEFIAKNDTAGLSKITFLPIALDPIDDKRVTSDEAKSHTWEYYTFHGKPVIADLAMLEKFKLDVQNVHSELLNYIKSKLGIVKFKIDSLILVDAPISRVVAAGMKFETKLFVAATSKEAVPQFFGSGSVQTTDGGYAAMMSMTAPGGFPAGKSEKEASYSASATILDASGGKQEMKLTGSYTIRKPEVVITSASVQNLYYKCGNTINVDVPALGEFYNPKFTASSAEVLTSSGDKRKVTIVPSGQRCILGVSSLTNGQNIKIDDISYKVIKPPKPSIQLIVNGKEYNGATPIPSKSRCMVRLKADSDFRSALPKDARYMITRVDLLSQRSLGAPTKVGSESGSGKDALAGIPMDLGNKLKSDPPGTKIFFKIDKIYRVNFKNAKIEEDFSDMNLYIGAVIK